MDTDAEGNEIDRPRVWHSADEWRGETAVPSVVQCTTAPSFIMIRGWAAVALSLGYVAVLFAVAWHGDRMARRHSPGRWTRGRPVVYALSLAVYCTSWTFYGSVGLAARTGYNFLPIYIGPILLFALGWPLVVRIIRVSKAHNITSIAYFIAARYGKSQMLAAVITIVAVVGTLPHIALQLKAVSVSFLTLTDDTAVVLSASEHGRSFWSDTALAVSVIMAVFAILFGTRQQVEATERHKWPDPGDCIRVGRQAGRIPHRRGLRHLGNV